MCAEILTKKEVIQQKKEEVVWSFTILCDLLSCQSLSPPCRNTKNAICSWRTLRKVSALSLVMDVSLWMVEDVWEFLTSAKTQVT